MNNNRSKLDRILSEGYEFDLGKYVSRGFEILQKDFGNFILFTLVSFLMILLIFIPVIGWFGVPLILFPVLSIGFYIAARKIDKGEPPELNDLFKGFDKLGQLALGALGVTVITSIAQIPYYMVNSEVYAWYLELLQNMSEIEDMVGEVPPEAPPWTFLLQIPGYLIQVIYCFTLPFIYFFDLNFWDGMEYSRKFTSKNYLWFLAFFIVISIIGGLGFIFCCIGALVTVPAYMCLKYAAFADITRLNEELGDDDGIESHLIVD